MKEIVNRNTGKPCLGWDMQTGSVKGTGSSNLETPYSRFIEWMNGYINNVHLSFGKRLKVVEKNIKNASKSTFYSMFLKI